jgi:DNA processing protein
VDEKEPEALYGLGERELLALADPSRTVTIVGSRRSGPYGREVARELGFGAASAGLLVVSGMALGCDSAAHEGALDANGATLAVLAGPADVPYPRSKEPLYRRILASGGAVLSERPSGTETKPGFFPARNRIMAALAGWVVIVEGAHRSGTQHTVKQAARLGREVLAVPGPVNSSLSELPNQLLSEGAPVVRDPQDLLDHVLGPGRTQVRGVGPELEPELRDALVAIEAGAGTCDAVAVALSLDGSSAAVALARLELMGYVAGDAVGRYSRTQLSPPLP